MSRYVNEFLSLRCSPDVLDTVGSLGNKPSKEITESVGVIKEIRKMILKHPMKYTLYDMGAGNALTSVMSAFLLPIKEAIAIDKRERKRNWHLAKKFSYWNTDLHKMNPDVIVDNSIIIAVHSCSSLSTRIIDIYLESKASYLVMMPCCIGEIDSTIISPFIVQELGKYYSWCWYLSILSGGSIKVDKRVLSPANVIITSRKDWK